MFYDKHFIQTFLIVLLLTVIPVLKGPAGDDVLHQHGVALHEDQLRHKVDGEPLQLPDLHVHSAQLNNGILEMFIKITERGKMANSEEDISGEAHHQPRAGDCLHGERHRTGDCTSMLSPECQRDKVAAATHI